MSTNPIFRWYHYAENFCRPTHCPICGAQVFFVRHNGGSVWFDSLGKPWPKHACFDTTYYHHRYYYREEEYGCNETVKVQELLLRYAERYGANSFGIVIEAEDLVKKRENRLRLWYANDKIYSIYINAVYDNTNLLGEIILVSGNEKYLLLTSM